MIVRESLKTCALNRGQAAHGGFNQNMRLISTALRSSHCASHFTGKFGYASTVTAPQRNGNALSLTAAIHGVGSPVIKVFLALRPVLRFPANAMRMNRKNTRFLPLIRSERMRHISGNIRVLRIVEGHWNQGVFTAGIIAVDFMCERQGYAHRMAVTALKGKSRVAWRANAQI